MSEPVENTGDATTATEGTPEESTEQPATQDSKPTEDEVKPKENGTGGREEEPKPAAAPPPKPKYRHDWYQTPTDVYINVMIKGLKNEDVSVNFGEKMASLMDHSITRKCCLSVPIFIMLHAGSNLLLSDDN